MTNDQLARAYLRNARRFIEEARGAQQPGLWHLCVRRSQETIEAATKAALRTHPRGPAPVGVASSKPHAERLATLPGGLLSPAQRLKPGERVRITQGPLARDGRGDGTPQRPWLARHGPPGRKRA